MSPGAPARDLGLYGRLLVEARPYWPHIAGLLLLNLLSVPLALAAPLPLKIVVDNVLGSHALPASLAWIVPETAGSTGALMLAIGLTLALAGVVLIRGFAASALDTYTGAKLLLQFRARLFQRVQRLSFSYHDRVGVTDSIYRIQYDAQSIQWVAVQGVIPFVTAAFTLAGMILITWQIDGQLALVALAVSPILFILTRLFRSRLRREWTTLKEAESSAMATLQESLGALRVVKAFGQEGREEQRFVTRSENGLNSQLRLTLINGSFDGLVGITIAGGTAAALFIGVQHVASGALTLGSLLLVMAYLAQLYGPLQAINRKIADLQASLASAERAFAVLDEVPDVVERSDTVPIHRATGAVAFRHVDFAYPGGGTVLHDVSFEVAPGTRVGIVGPTGAGKTTLISLLVRFYDPVDGLILLDGRDLRDYELAGLRRQFAIVPQESVLFSTSIAENIAYARPEADHAAIVEAARRANAHDFISRLPAGYDTLVGERGMMLSGGERQRIALARAFLKDAPILILDEPTSSIDTRTESSILEAMDELMKGRTSFMIAHRPSTLETADLLLRVEAGRLTVMAEGSLASAGEGPSPHFHEIGGSAGGWSGAPGRAVASTERS